MIRIRDLLGSLEAPNESLNRRPKRRNTEK